MSLFTWADSKIKDFRWYHISLTKLSVLFATLMLVKFFPQMTSLDWYWYLILALVAATPVWMKMMK